MNPVAKAALTAMSAVDDVELAEAVRRLNDETLCDLVYGNEALQLSVAIELLHRAAAKSDDGATAACPDVPDEEDGGEPTGQRPTEALRAETAVSQGPGDKTFEALEAAGSLGLTKADVVERTGLTSMQVGNALNSLKITGRASVEGPRGNTRWYATT